jgi:hypothetical protein
MPETPEIPDKLPLAAEAAVIAEATPLQSEGEMAETIYVPDNAKEHEPMLDVHVPHPTHTWKDFFIHIATIVGDLLIAVGVEQLVRPYCLSNTTVVFSPSLPVSQDTAV